MKTMFIEDEAEPFLVFKLRLGNAVSIYGREDFSEMVANMRDALFEGSTSSILEVFILEECHINPFEDVDGEQYIFCINSERDLIDFIMKNALFS